MIEKKLHEIADVLFEDMADGKVDRQETLIGLFSGHTGILIFCRHYLARYPDPHKEQIMERYMDACFDRLTSDPNMLTYCSGMAGALEGLRYLNRRKLLEVDFSDIEEHYKPILQSFALSYISKGDFDYLHGGLGIVKYFPDDTEFVHRALDALEERAEKQGETCKWVSSLGIDRGQGYNISLSHGMSSIVSVLCLLPRSEQRDRIITRTCNYILSQELDPQKYGNMFPSQSMENPEESGHSRMGWCYGDLGIATTLWQAGKALDNPAWREKAVEVMNFSAHRRSPKGGGINDAGLCHGGTGVAMMFHYMYLQTGNEPMKETRDYWIDITIKMGTLEEGLAGYSAWRATETPPWKNEYGLLEGISGIGLALLTIPDDDPRASEWMNFFLLN